MNLWQQENILQFRKMNSIKIKVIILKHNLVFNNQ